MTQGERVRKARKDLNLTLEKFGKALGVGKTAISKIENNERKLTEQMTLSICREFRVNYYWLAEEQLPVILETPETITDEIAEDYNLDEIDKKIIQKYLELGDEHRQVLKDYLKSIFT